MYYYKLRLRNELIYHIKDKESNIVKFMETIAKDRNWRDFVLANEEYYNYQDNRGITYNTVTILTSEIIAVEYATERY